MAASWKILAKALEMLLSHLYGYRDPQRCARWGRVTFGGAKKGWYPYKAGLYPQRTGMDFMKSLVMQTRRCAPCI